MNWWIRGWGREFAGRRFRRGWEGECRGGGGGWVSRPLDHDLFVPNICGC